MEVYDTIYGDKVYDVKNLIETTYQLDTSDWKSGLDVVRVVVEDEVLTEKMTIEK